MKQILITLPLTEGQKERFERTAPQCRFIYIDKASVTEEIIKQCSAVIGNLPPALLSKNPDIEWVQLNSAGTDGYTENGILPETAALTNATGAYGVAIAEHMVGALLLLLKKFPSYIENQKNRQWKDEGTVKPIYQTTTLIVGMGDIGTEFAKRMKAFGSHIIGIRRTIQEKPACVDEIYQTEALKEQLKRADIVAICLPGTKETCHLFSREVFHAMKKDSVLLNVGRGNIIDSEALISALEEGRIGGASIDVCEQEPLPEDSPLWNCKNLFITPHVSGGFHLPHTLEQIVEISLKNLEAYLNNTPYVSLVDKKTGYKISGR